MRPKVEFKALERSVRSTRRKYMLNYVPGHGKSDHQESNTPQGRIQSLGAVRQVHTA